MCNNPEMVRLLRDEIRAGMAARKARAPRGGVRSRGWQAVACAAAACLVIAALA